MILESPREVNTLFGWYRNYSDGFLPFTGAITDQPNVVVEAFQEISMIKGILDHEDAENAREGNSNPSDDGSGFKVIASSKR